MTLLEINVWRQTWGEKITSFKEALLNLWFIQILMSFDSTWFVVFKRHLTVGSSTRVFSVAVVFHVWEVVLLFEACCFCFYFSSLPCLGVWENAALSAGQVDPLLLPPPVLLFPPQTLSALTHSLPHAHTHTHNLCFVLFSPLSLPLSVHKGKLSRPPGCQGGKAFWVIQGARRERE